MVAKVLVAWFVMAWVAIVNGAVRDLTYGLHMDDLPAQQVATTSGIVLLGIVMWFFIRRYRPASAAQAFAIGFAWMALTVAFEFLFFHYAMGRTWAELRANYDVLHGRPWLFVLLWVAVAPCLFFWLQGSRQKAAG